MSRYYLDINGAGKVLCEELGWSIETISLRSLAADEVLLRRVRRPGASLALAFEDSVTVYRDDTVIFRGTAMPPATTASDRGQTATVTLKNWWWQAQDTTWCYMPWGPLEVGDIITAEGGISNRMDYVDSPATSPVSRDMSRYMTADSSLFPGTDGSWDKTVRGELQYVLAFLEQNIPGLLDFDDTTWELGTVTPEPRERRVTDRRVSDLLIEIMHNLPSAFLTTDYSGVLPMIHAANATELSATEVRHGRNGLMAHALSPMPDLRIKGVVIRQPFEGFSSAFDRPFAYMASQTVHYPLMSARLARPGMLSVSLGQISGAAAEYNDFGDLLAQQIYEQLNPLRSRGSLEWHDPDQALGILPGRKLTLYDAELDFGELLVQEVTHTVATQRTVAAVGYPRALGLNEIADLGRWLKFAFYGQASLGSRPTLPPGT